MTALREELEALGMAVTFHRGVVTMSNDEGEWSFGPGSHQAALAFARHLQVSA